MNQYTEIIKTYLSEKEPKYEQGIHSLLDMLFWHYTLENPVEDSKIRGQFRGLEDILGPLGNRQADVVMDKVTDLCFDYQQTAFQEGMRAGARLMLELTRQETECGV